MLGENRIINSDCIFWVSEGLTNTGAIPDRWYINAARTNALRKQRLKLNKRKKQRRQRTGRRV
jgi:hypothetical protein